MVSSLIAPQYHDDTFWTFSQPALEEDIPNDFDTPRYLEFANDFEVRKRKHNIIILFMINFPQYAHFHGTEDTTAPYEGANPGGDMINNVEMYAAQW